MARVPKGCSVPRFRRGDVVAEFGRRDPIWQILKIRWDEEGKPIYKIRHYNSLAFFSGDWVKETELQY